MPSDKLTIPVPTRRRTRRECRLIATRFQWALPGAGAVPRVGVKRWGAGGLACVEAGVLALMNQIGIKVGFFTTPNVQRMWRCNKKNARSGSQIQAAINNRIEFKCLPFQNYQLTRAESKTAKHQLNGFTIVDLLILFVIILCALIIVLPAIATSRLAEQATQCKLNMGQLGQGAIRHSIDHRGKFYIEWQRSDRPPWSPQTFQSDRWWSWRQAGQYSNNAIKLLWKPPYDSVNGKVADWGNTLDAGMGGSGYTCPGEDEPAYRSYHFNFWASHLDPPANLHQWLAARKIDPSFYPGIFFDQNSDNLDQTLLFGEAKSIAHSKPYDDDEYRWATTDEFGGRGTPGERFGGFSKHSDGIFTDFNASLKPARWPDRAENSFIDYGRHGGDVTRKTASGDAIFCLADGSAVAIAAENLFDQETTVSTYALYWSPADPLARDTNINAK